MDFLRAATATFGSLLYVSASTVLYVVPKRYRKPGYYFLDLQGALANLLFGRLLPDLQPAHNHLSGKTALVTGANSGIGLAIVKGLVARGCIVFMGCRSEAKAATAREEVLQLHPASSERVHPIKLDTSDLESIQSCVKHLAEKGTKLDILVHNAGISTAPADQPLSRQDFELVYATNFLGSFFMTYLLENHLTPTARVILTSSHGQYGGKFSNTFSTEQVTGRRESGFHCPPSSSNSAACYANTKAMQCVFAKLLQRRLDRQGSSRRVAHAFTPGFTSTAIFSKTLTETWREDPGFRFLKATEGLLATDVDQGAATGLWLASTDDEAVAGTGNGGRYWDRMQAKSCSADLLDEGLLAKLWQRWEADAGVEWR